MLVAEPDQLLIAWPDQQPVAEPDRPPSVELLGLLFVGVYFVDERLHPQPVGFVENLQKLMLNGLLAYRLLFLGLEVPLPPSLVCLVSRI